MIALRDAAALGLARPDVRKLFFDVDGKDYLSVHAFAQETKDGVALISRHFADFGGIVEDPFTGHEGKYVKVPPRNVLPKPLQKPHPPLWMACSRRESILGWEPSF